MSFQLGHEVEHTQHVHIRGRGQAAPLRGIFTATPNREVEVGTCCLGYLWLEGGMESWEKTPGGAQHSQSKTFALKGAIHNFLE